MRRILLLCLIPLAFLAGCAKSKQNSTPQVILRYADNQPQDHPATKAARYFAQLVKERTEGKVDVQVYAEGELGNEANVLEQIRFGGVDISRFSLGTLSASDPQLGILMLPYLYRDADHMWNVLDGEIGERFLSGFSVFNAVGLCWFDAGARSFYTRNPVNTMADLQGLRIRVMENARIASFVSTTGAIPVQLPYSDVYASLRMMNVDGAENNMPSYVAMRHLEVAPYFLKNEYLRIPEVLVMATSAERRVTEVDPAFVDIIRECAKEAGLYERQQWTIAEQNALSAMQDAGCVITVPDAAEMAAFKAAMQIDTASFSDEERNLLKRIQQEGT